MDTALPRTWEGLLYTKSSLEETESPSAMTFHWLSYGRLPLVELSPGGGVVSSSCGGGGEPLPV